VGNCRIATGSQQALRSILFLASFSRQFFAPVFRAESVWHFAARGEPAFRLASVESIAGEFSAQGAAWVMESMPIRAASGLDVLPQSVFSTTQHSS